MNSKQFLWHAKRGHGECVKELERGFLKEHLNSVKKIVLSNYAFLRFQEFRSSFAYQLASYYENDEYYIDLLIKKMKRIELEDDYTFSYLVDTLYFFLKNKKKNDYLKELINILNKKLKKPFYSINESHSISSLISLIFDLFGLQNYVIELINGYYLKYNESTLDVSIIEFDYNVKFNKSHQLVVPNIYEAPKDNSSLLKKINDEKWFNYNLPMLSHLTKDRLNKLINGFIIGLYDLQTNKKILKLLILNGYNSFSHMKALIDSFGKFDEDFDRNLLEVLCTVKSKELKKFGFSLLNTKFKSYGIRIILKNYDKEDYKVISKNIRKIKIDYENKENWYEIEESLIFYFKRKNIDIRLLNEVRWFIQKGLSSYSRYILVKLLLKKDTIKFIEKENLRWDANVKIRELIERSDF